jgi:hypothetical protein
MKTEPQPRQHHEGEPPPESLIHHDEPTLLEQWIRGLAAKGVGFWMGITLILGGAVAAIIIAYRVGGPSREGLEAWNELASIGVAPSSLMPFGPDPNAGLPERLREIARAHPGTLAAQWAELRAASLLLNEGSAELATSRRSAGAGKVIEADGIFAELYEDAKDDFLKRMAALGKARAAEARLGLDPDDPDRAQLDEVTALYDAVIEDYSDTPEAKQAAALRRRLVRSDSIAFYDQLSRFDPGTSSAPGGSDFGLPGMTLPPGGSGAIDDLFGLPPGGSGSGSGSGSGLPGGSIPGLEGFNLSPPIDPGTPAEPGAAPEATPTPTPSPDTGTLPDLPGLDLEPPSDAPEPSPAPVTPQVPDDPFGGSSTPAPSPAPAPEEPAPDAPSILDEPAPVDPGPAPADEPGPSGNDGGGLPDDVFPGAG